jgi:hypothetical protein
MANDLLGGGGKLLCLRAWHGWSAQCHLEGTVMAGIGRCADQGEAQEILEGQVQRLGSRQCQWLAWQTTKFSVGTLIFP